MSTRRRPIFMQRRNQMLTPTNLLLAGILAVLLVAAIWDSVSL